MNNFRFLPFHAGVAACVSLLFAQAQAAEDKARTLTPDAVAAEVLAKNPEVAFYEAEIAAAKGERRTAGTYANPELNTELGGKTARDRTTGGLLGEGVAWSVSVQQTFEWPGRMALRKAIANKQITLAELGQEKFRTALAAQARMLALKLFVAQEKARVASEVADRFHALQEVLVQRETAGVTPLLEQRILEANSVTLQRRASESRLNAKAAIYELNQLRGESFSKDVVISTEKFRFNEAPAVTTLLAQARDNNFELRMRQAELQQQGFKVSLEELEKNPSITVGPFVRQERADIKETVAGVSLSIPLPLWNRNKGGVETAQARVRQAETTMLLSQRSIERQVREQAETYKSKLEEMSRWRPDAARSLREAAELGDRHYRLGALPIATYTELQRQYLDAMEALLDTRSEAYMAAQELEVLTGVRVNPATATSSGKAAK
jgi:cobalt-zinc-cadmium efflux system outer membrane protein